MNLVVSFAGAVLLTSAPAAVPAQAPAPANVCLNPSNIQRTEAPDDRTVVFYMRDGKVWQNRLKTACPMLRTSPFTQVLRAGGLVCANQQSIQVAQTGSTCVLGDFTPLPSER